MLVYNSKVAFAVNLIVNLFGEEGILIFSLYEVNKLRTVVLNIKKRRCVDQTTPTILRATIEL